MEQSRTSSSITIPATMRTVNEPKWRALRAISFLLKILAWLTLIGGVVATGYLIAMDVQTPMSITVNHIVITGIVGSIIGGLPISSPTLIGAFLLFLILYAHSELITVLISIERNTRTHY